MASIPLPALALKPIEQPDVLQNYARLAQLKGIQQEQQQRAQMAPLQQQEAQQSIQAGAMQNQLTQQDLQDQQNFRQAMQDPSMKGKTIGQVADTLASQGKISQKAWIAAKDADVKASQGLATLDATRATNLKNAYGATLPIYTNVQKMDDPSIASNWGNIAAQYDAIWQPILHENPQLQGQIPTLDPNQPMTKAQLAQFGPMLQLGQTYAEQDLKMREQAAKTTQEEQKAQFGPEGPAAEAKYRFILQKDALKQPLTADELAFARSYEASESKATTASDTLGVTSTSVSHPAGLSSLRPTVAPMAGAPPQSVRQPIQGQSGQTGSTAPRLTPSDIKNDTVDLIGQYRMDPALLGRMLYRHPEMLGLIQSRYPDWDQTQYQAKNKIVQSYTSGPESRSINAIGTALGHANELRDAIDALNNGDSGLKTLRSLGNRYSIEVGNDPVTAFNLIVHRLAPEITAAYVQGGGGEAERAASAADFDPSLGRQQLIKNWSETVKLLQSKVAQQQQQWDTTYRPSRPQDQFGNRFFSAPAKTALQRWTNETGNAPAISVSGTAGPKIGDTKKFPNGRTGKWDGQGWVAQ